MKRLIKAALSVDVPLEDSEKLVEAIETALTEEDIPYVFVNSICDPDDDEIFIVAVTYGDWKNDNDRADDVIKQKFNPDSVFSEDVDPYDYIDDELAARYEGSDSCVTRHEWIWNR